MFVFSQHLDSERMRLALRGQKDAGEGRVGWVVRADGFGSHTPGGRQYQNHACKAPRFIEWSWHIRNSPNYSKVSALPGLSRARPKELSLEIVILFS
jgi:hypothetical protein